MRAAALANSSGGVQVTNSTISGNSAGKTGGGIASSGVQLLTARSVATRQLCGGIYTVRTIPVHSEISNTILNAGVFGENIFNNGGTVTSHGYNLSSDDGGGLLNGPGDQINTDPLLGPLRNHGGPTLTHVPIRGSPAIDAGDPSFTQPLITTNAARVFSGCSVLALMSVQSRHNHGRSV